MRSAVCSAPKTNRGLICWPTPVRRGTQRTGNSRVRQPSRAAKPLRITLGAKTVEGIKGRLRSRMVFRISRKGQFTSRNREPKLILEENEAIRESQFLATLKSRLTRRPRMKS